MTRKSTRRVPPQKEPTPTNPVRAHYQYATEGLGKVKKGKG